MSRSNLYIIIAAVVVLLIVGGYYLSTKSGNSGGLYGTPTPTPTATPMPTNMDMSPTPTPSQSATATTKEFTITGNADAFSPKQLIVTKGDTVKITFKPTDTTHTFTLPDFNVDTGDVSAGQTKTVQFVANKTGTFQFYCTLHKSMGMTGTLTVQ